MMFSICVNEKNEKKFRVKKYKWFRRQEKGRLEGGKQKAFEIARKMKQHGDDIDYIAMVSGLAPAEIKTLQ